MDENIVSEENSRDRRTTWRDPLPHELTLPEFDAVWECIKNWDIGLPFDITSHGGQLYSGATGNHVVAILDALRGVGVVDPIGDRTDGVLTGPVLTPTPDTGFNKEG